MMSSTDPNEMIAFWNSALGITWEYRGELPEEDTLRARAERYAERYAEWTCPVGGLEIFATIDVQHDRLAVTVWAFGRGEEMWLVHWGELYGQTIVAHAGAWVDLEILLGRRVRHATGVALPISAAGIDCSDGQTSMPPTPSCASTPAPTARCSRSRARPTRWARSRSGRPRKSWTPTLGPRRPLASACWCTSSGPPRQRT